MSNEITGERTERLRYLLSRAFAGGDFVAVWDGGWCKGEELQEELRKRAAASTDVQMAVRGIGDQHSPTGRVYGDQAINLLYHRGLITDDEAVEAKLLLEFAS